MNNKYVTFCVDDDNMFLQMLKDVLEDDSRLDIHLFLSGEECLKELDKKPDIVILDHNFTSNGHVGMDGLRILHKILKQLPDAKTIILSAQEDGETVFKYSMDGAKDYVIKDEEVFENIKSSLDDIISSLEKSKR